MPRLRRRLLNLLTGLSLLLCVAACALWVRSYFVGDAWDWGTRTGRAGVDSCRGSLSVGRVEVPPAALATIPRGHLFISKPASQAASQRLKPAWSFAGFALAHVSIGGMRATELHVPYWIVVLAAGVLPAVYLRRRFRVPPSTSTCRRCGYDLRATPQRCPECGTPSSGKPEARNQKSESNSNDKCPNAQRPFAGPAARGHSSLPFRH